jgi:pimeloyl-ACP methyl ester carboxylesterase
MRRGWKVLIGVLAVLVVLIGINAVVTGRETKTPEVTVPGAEILSLTGGELQVLEKGPRKGSPIVLLHCYTCSMNWWFGMMPRLERGHRVIAIDLLGHGGSDKPTSGYSIENQADLVAQALGRLGVRGATVVGHSLGGIVSVALAERSPKLVDRLVIIDTSPDKEHEGDLGVTAALGFLPVIGEALWRVKPDFAIRDGLEVAFAPGFDVPDAFVEDVKRMNYSAYDETPRLADDYVGEAGLPQRIRRTGKPLLVIMGAEEQVIDDPQGAIDAYAAAVPTAFGNLIRGVGHSPNVEEPTLTARFVKGFAGPPRTLGRAGGPAAVQDRVQDREDVRDGS